MTVKCHQIFGGQTGQVREEDRRQQEREQVQVGRGPVAGL